MAKKVKPEKDTMKVLIPEVVKPFGRPTIYKDDYCQLLVDHMASGFSFESFGAVIDSSKDTLYHWANTIPDFSEAKKKGRIKQLFHDENILNGMAIGKPGNAAALIFKMKNCHKWTDKQEIQINAQDTEKLLLEAQQALVELLADNSNKDKDEN